VIYAAERIGAVEDQHRGVALAQLARAYDPGPGIRGKVRSAPPVAIPLVSNALARTTVLGLTIDMRGYRNRPQRPIRDRPFARLDTVSCVILAAGWVLYITRAFTIGV